MTASRRVELRSDTFTRPTPAMRRAMYEAEVGDDVWNEDPTVHRLEALSAELTGMEAGLLVSSGTQGNLVALLTHASRGSEVIVGDPSHTYLDESAGTAVVGGIQLHPIPVGPHGYMDPSAVRAAIRSGENVHHPPTAAVSIENTHQATAGKPVSRDAMAAIADVAHAAGVAVHVDGARVFNAAVALDMPASTLLEPVDSVTFCLSKGLGAPVGSVLCGPAEYIARARRWRKLLGGGMRQAGVLAAAGIVALEEGIDRLVDDHVHARRLARGLAAVPGITVDPPIVETNILFFTVDGDASRFVAEMAERGVLVAPMGERVRAVTSYEVSAADIDYALETAAAVARDLSPALA